MEPLVTTKPQRTNRPWLTIAESAAHIGVTPYTIRNWIAAGRLPASRLGTKAIRIHRDDLDRLFTPMNRDGR